MLRRPAKPTIALVAFTTVLSAAPLSFAAPTTSRGQISVAQVVEMLEKASTDRTARQVLTSYLAGVGEAASAVVSMGSASCRTSLSLNAATVGQTIRSAAGGRDAGETPATPLIVRDMLNRAGCARQ